MAATALNVGMFPMEMAVTKAASSLLATRSNRKCASRSPPRLVSSTELSVRNAHESYQELLVLTWKFEKALEKDDVFIYWRIGSRLRC